MPLLIIILLNTHPCGAAQNSSNGKRMRVKRDMNNSRSLHCLYGLFMHRQELTLVENLWLSSNGE